MESSFGPELVGLACPIQLDGRLVLGSGSPRRKELLSLFGLPFEVRTADTAEIAPAGLSDIETVRFVAKEKADALVPTLQLRLRYLLGGDRPSQTDHQILSGSRMTGNR